MADQTASDVFADRLIELGASRWEGKARWMPELPDVEGFRAVLAGHGAGSPGGARCGARAASAAEQGGELWH
jgi:hypothetical protein